MRNRLADARSSRGALFRLAVPLAGVVAAAACEQRPRALSSAPQVDTLDDGTIAVTHTAPDTVAAAELVVRLGSADGAFDDAFGRIGALGLDQQDNIYVLDAMEREVRVFDAGGTLVRRFGREGEGPGEMGSADGLLVDSSGTTWVRDLRLRRFSRFGPDGRFDSAAAIPRSSGVRMSWGATWLDDGRLLDWHVDYPGRTGRSPGSTLALTPVAISWHTGAVDSFSTWTVPLDVVEGTGTLRPLGVRSVLATHGSGAVWWAYGRDYRLERRDLSGRIRLEIRIPTAEPEAISPQVRDSVGTWIRTLPPETSGGLTVQDVPESWAIVERVAVGPDGLVAVFPRLAGTGSGRVMDLFGADGRWLARVLLPVVVAHDPAPVLSGRRLVAVTRDSLGVESAVVLGLPGDLARAGG